MMQHQLSQERSQNLKKKMSQHKWKIVVQKLASRCSRFKVDRGFSHVKEGGPSGLGSGQRKGGGPVNVLPQ